MDNRYSADHVADDHIHTDITCNIEEPNKRTDFGTVSYRLPRGGLKHVLMDPNLRL